MKKLQNADKMLELLPGFLASSAAEGLPIEEDLVKKIKEMLSLGLDPTEVIDAYYDEKLKNLSSNT
ncbi:MAG: hypothetical protein ABS939_15540 [Psychrobacillus sp.]